MNLPMHPRLTDQDIQDMVTGIKNTVAKLRKRHCLA
jgi:dTDP-4-amino-4,6-dideoxygalactose transaminase